MRGKIITPISDVPRELAVKILTVIVVLTITISASFGVQSRIGADQNQPLFTDVFERRDLGGSWTVISGTWSIVKGKLIQREPTPIDHFILANFSASDFVFEVKCKTIVSPKLRWYEGHRIIFRCDEEVTKGYALLRSQNNSVILYDVSGWEPIFVADDRPFTHGQWETLRVEAIGSMIYCYLNDELLIEFNDTSYRYREGFFALDASFASCEFDDVRVAVADVLPPTISVAQFESLLKTGEGIVTVSATDEGSGMREVILLYSTDGGAEWKKIYMKQEASVFKGVIPAQPYRTVVSYYIEASDKGLNRAKTGISTYEVGLTLRYLYMFVAPISGGLAAISLKFRKAKGGRVMLILSSGVLLAFSLVAYTIPTMLLSVMLIGLNIPLAAWKSARRRFARGQLAKGLVQYKGRWGTPLQVEEWRKMDRGLVKYKGAWITPQERFAREQAEKGLILFINRKGEESWGTQEQVTEWRRIDGLLKKNFAGTGRREFEDFITGLLERMGYRVEVGPIVRGVGREIIATRERETVIVHAKRNKPNERVKVREIRQILDRMSKYDATKSMIITTSDFTDAARRLAKGAPIELWNRRDLHDAVDRYVFLRYVIRPPKKAPPRKKPKRSR